MRWSTCWSRRPTAVISASAPGATSGVSAAGNVRPANFAPTALRAGWQRECPLHEPREPTPARSCSRSSPISRSIRRWRGGGSLPPWSPRAWSDSWSIPWCFSGSPSARWNSCPARSSARPGWCWPRSRSSPCSAAATKGSGCGRRERSALDLPARRAMLDTFINSGTAMLSPDLVAILRSVSTATITTILLKKGVRRTWMHGPKPLETGYARAVGPAFTLRFVPAREDLATPESWASPRSTRGAIEDMPEGVIAVADAMGVTGAGIFGDILTARMRKRGVAALVTDGVMRDVAGVLGTRLPVWSAGVAAPASVSGLTFVGWQEPIGCGGFAVFPNDVIVADDDGGVVIPAALVEPVAKEGPEQERFEAWVVREVENGAKLPGLYPPNEATRARYEKERR